MEPIVQTFPTWNLIGIVAAIFLANFAHSDDKVNGVATESLVFNTILVLSIIYNLIEIGRWLFQ